MLNADIPSVRIRAFRSIDDTDACDRYIEGHKKVLDNIGVKKITSFNNKWKSDINSFTILVESMDSSKVYGGARIQKSDGREPLPIELATGYLDPRIHELVKELHINGTGELCGLWNSMEIAGLGIGAFYMTKAGVVIAEQLNIKSIFALCAPVTVRFANKVGCTICKEVGNNGTFYYPKLDLIATVVLLKDSQKLDSADAEDRESIFHLRNNLNTVVVEKTLRNHVNIEIHYDLKIKPLSL
jgi:hypothetical protein